MPQIFQREDGTQFEADLSFAELEKARLAGQRFKINGEVVTRQVREELKREGKLVERPKVIHSWSLWSRPFASDALGVLPSQASEAEEEMRRMGVPTEFDRKTGQAIITSEEHFRNVAKASGLFTGRDGYAARDDEGRIMQTGQVKRRSREELVEAISKAMHGD